MGRSIAKFALALGLATMLLAVFSYLRKRDCERQSRSIEWRFEYDDRLRLRSVTTAPDVPTGAPNWEVVRLRLERHMREWSELRARACMENRAELEDCLDSQKASFSALVDAWISGDLSWAENDLDELLPPVSDCIGPKD